MASSLVAPITDDYQVDISEDSQKTETKPSANLDKDDFLLLLVTEMQYQDPLNPASNTEYVAQLAQFSALEQMQNLNATTENTSAFSLVGKQVYIQSESSTGNTTEVQGIVDYVTIKNNSAYVSVDGTLYSYEDIVQVIDESYLISQYVPSVAEQTLQFYKHDAQDVKITGIDLGSNGYEATSVAAVIVDADGETTPISTDKLSYSKGTLTIDKSAFADIAAGTYNIALAFNDANSSIYASNVTLIVKGVSSASSDSDTSGGTDNGGTNDSTTDDSATGDTAADSSAIGTDTTTETSAGNTTTDSNTSDASRS